MTDWAFRLIDATGYFGVFLLMMLETVFPPIPSEVIMPIAGVRAAHGPMTLPGVIASGTAGAMAGNLVWYGFARRIGLERFKRFIDRYGRWLTLDWGDVEKVRRGFRRYGGAIVFFARLTPNFRTFVSVPAGLTKMKLLRFLAWSTLGTAVWSGLLAAAGYALGSQFEKIERIIGPVSTVIVVAIVLFYIWRQVTWTRRHESSGSDSVAD
ncbi:DedA family protein [Sphingosinicella sp. LHD-64]|uniref:DedA family protein n=1 Tax=Sphingosinicella sp. LHD-64 TaxID=3072139 RepID=UPI00280ED113|nr:DedA family protein [Sphingosinicella sp. LHD-64]MDQ8756440.1 DedA family protein [Sphingosinicella sp. LHD-64]